MQSVDAIEPWGDCEFAGQLVQLALPVTLLYVFASQIAQISPFAPVNPGLQLQLLDDIEPGKDCEFGRQSTQLRLPIAVLYVFAWQIVQLPPSGPVNP